MSATKKFLRRIQEDCYQRALASAELANVGIVLVRRALTPSMVEQQLKTIKGRAGKVGICLFVEMPSVDVPAPNVPGPSTTVVQTFLVLEHPTINEGSLGTGTDAENVAVDVLQLFHQFIPYGVTQVMIAAPNAITPENAFENLVGYTVTLTTEVALRKPAKVALPTITPRGGPTPASITLACATPEAVIRYTLDGSYPGSANTAALTYSAPFNLATGATLRVGAEKSGLQPSDIAQEIFF
jgi:hypothetical protein